MFKDVRATIEIDLSKSEEELWNSLHKDARWGINRAKKENLEIKEVGKDESYWKEFYEIYKITITRGGIPPENLEKLREETDNLFLCLKENKIIAGAAIKIKKDTLELFLNASLFDYLKYQPNNLLYWHLIRWAKEKGFKIFDLGGYQLKARGHLEGVNKFKAKWGGEIVEKEVTSRNPLYVLARKIIRNFYFVKKTKDWTMLKWYIIKEYLKNKKISATLKKALEKIVYYEREVILYSSSLESVPSIIPEISVKAKKAGLSDLGNIKGLPLTRKYKERFEEGQECFILLSEEKPVHYSWIDYKKMNIKEANTLIFLNSRGEEKEACVYDCYTHEDYRSKKLYSAMLCFLQKYLKKKGFSKCYIYAELENKYSINGIEKAGFKKEKIIYYRRILFFRNRRVGKIKE